MLHQCRLLAVVLVSAVTYCASVFSYCTSSVLVHLANVLYQCRLLAVVLVSAVTCCTSVFSYCTSTVLVHLANLCCISAGY